MLRVCAASTSALRAAPVASSFRSAVCATSVAMPISNIANNNNTTATTAVDRTFATPSSRHLHTTTTTTDSWWSTSSKYDRVGSARRRLPHHSCQRHLLASSYNAARLALMTASHTRGLASDNPSTTVTATPPERIRNVAIIAHVDHGKTTLVDGLLKQSDTRNMEGERVMDSNAQEKERGITILAKSTAITYNAKDGQSYQLNIVDTPGHADFGGEVERMMAMVDGVALVVCAFDGPMTQTKYVLSKAIKKGLKAFVVLNKIDRSNPNRIAEVENEVFDLFVQLGASEAQLDFPFVYASARSGWASLNRDAGDDQKTSLGPLFETIVKHIPPPNVKVDAPFSMLVTNIERNTFFGKMLLGKIHSGKVKPGDTLHAVDPSGKSFETIKVTKILCKRGLEQSVIAEAHAGDIVSLAGFQEATVNSTLAHPSVTTPIPSVPIDPPTVSMAFAPNTSPVAGQEGTPVTAGAIRERLQAECEHNVSLKVVDSDSREHSEVHARGELQLGVLIETLRREKIELSIFPPKVVLKRDEEGKLLEPVEECIIDVPKSDATTIMQMLTSRNGTMTEFMDLEDGRTKMTFLVPTRGLLGFRAYFQNETRGSGIFNHVFHSYAPFGGSIDRNPRGALISMDDGIATTYALESAQARGTMFISPGAKVYAGMVVGESSKEIDIEINPAKAKAFTNVRTVSKDEKVKLVPPRQMSLEEAISSLRDDEMLEVTPAAIRLRKVELDSGKRAKMARVRQQERRAEKAAQGKSWAK